MKNILIASLLLLLSYTVCFGQCPLTVTITGPYATAYTGSATWIASSGVTQIPSTANVILDANPLTNGYVLLDVGFETLPSATFLAIVVTPCSGLGIDEFAEGEDLKLYPNPATGIVNILSTSSISKIEVMDMKGSLLQTITPQTNETALNLEGYASGVYFIHVSNSSGRNIRKIMKE